jgi:MFS family permease
MDRIWGYSTWQIGLAITPGPAILIVVNAFAGPYADRHGYRRLIVAGSFIACAGTLWLALFFGPDRSYVVAFLPATLLIGTGMGMSMGPMNSAALKDIARDSLAEGNAAFNTVRYLGASIGVALAIAALGDLDRPDLADAFQRALVLLAGIMIVAPLLVAIAYPRDARPETLPAT